MPNETIIPVPHGSLPAASNSWLSMLVFVLIIISALASIIVFVKKDNKSAKKIAKYGWVITIILIIIYILAPPIAQLIGVR